MVLLLSPVAVNHSQDHGMVRVGRHLTGWFVGSNLALCPALFGVRTGFIPALWPCRFQAALGSQAAVVARPLAPCESILLSQGEGCGTVCTLQPFFRLLSGWN